MRELASRRNVHQRHVHVRSWRVMTPDATWPALLSHLSSSLLISRLFISFHAETTTTPTKCAASQRVLPELVGRPPIGPKWGRGPPQALHLPREATCVRSYNAAGHSGNPRQPNGARTHSYRHSTSASRANAALVTHSAPREWRELRADPYRYSVLAGAPPVNPAPAARNDLRTQKALLHAMQNAAAASASVLLWGPRHLCPLNNVRNCRRPSPFP